MILFWFNLICFIIGALTGEHNHVGAGLFLLGIPFAIIAQIAQSEK